MVYGLTVRNSNGDTVLSTNNQTFQLREELTVNSSTYGNFFNLYYYNIPATDYILFNIPVGAFVGKGIAQFSFISNLPSLTYREFIPANKYSSNNQYGMQIYNAQNEITYTSDLPIGSIYKTVVSNYFLETKRVALWYDGNINQYAPTYYPTNAHLDQDMSDTNDSIITDGEDWFGIPDSGIFMFPANTFSSITLYRRETNKIYLIQKPFVSTSSGNNTGVLSSLAAFNFLTAFD